MMSHRLHTTAMPTVQRQEHRKARAKRRGLGCLGIGVLGLILFGSCAALSSGGDEETEPTTEISVPAQTSAPTLEPTEPLGEEPEPEQPADEPNPDGGEQSSLTVAQQNAVRSAENYLDFAGFSRTELIGQLEFEGFSTEDATIAVDSLDTDYMQEAAESAESYMEFTSFSRQGLVDQLMFEGYTREQAEHGANTVGL